MIGCKNRVTIEWRVPVRALLACGLLAGCFHTDGMPRYNMADGFESGDLAEDRWYLAQADLALINFVEEDVHEGSGSLAISVNDTSLTPPIAPSPEDLQTLSYSLVDQPDDSQDCPQGAEADVTRIQRNEIRVAEPLQPPLPTDQWYRFSFKIDGDIPQCGSTRWVIGQWKQNNKESPFVAQRFDNGVFHVSVQDGHCRCRITKAPGDPDVDFLATESPLKCINTQSGGTQEGESCESAVRVRYGNTPELPDPRVDWVEMMYRIRAAPGGDGLVEIYANGERKATVYGPIGYEEAQEGIQYFKVGNYRNYMPGEATLSVDAFQMYQGAVSAGDGPGSGKP